MVVAITVAVALALHQLRRGVQDVLGRQQRAVLLGRAHRRLVGGVDAIRFRRGREIDAGLGKRQLPFRRAQIVVGVLGGIADDQSLRIGKPDVLDRHAHQPPSEIERILTGIEHAAEIVERRIRVGAAHGLVQGRDQVVVAVLALVVDGGAALDDAGEPLRIEDLTRTGGAPDLFGERQGSAAIAVGHADEAGTGIGIERQRLALPRLGAFQKRLDAVFVMGLEGQHPGAGQKGGIELEGWILRRRPDEDHGSVFHDGKKTVLLGAVEPMNLVDEEQRLAPFHPAHAGGFEDLLQVGDAGEDRRDLFEGEARLARQQPRHGCLAGARRAPEDHRTKRAGSDHAGKNPVLAGQVLLACDFGQRLRPQPIGQRPARLDILRHMRGEEIAHRKICRIR